jgi:ribonuclease BN (tRNA processing enzyme)
MANHPAPTCAVSCLGVGEGWPCADRRHAAFLYRFGAAHLLVDCGDGLSSTFKARGDSYDLVDRVFLTHMHSDHVGGFSLFVQGLWLEKRRRPLPVHLPAAGIPALKAWLNATILFEDLVGFPVYWEPLAPAVKIRDGEVTVTPHPTTHLESLRRAFQKQHRTGAFDSYGFTLEAAGRRVGHSGDIGHVDDLDPLLEQPLDLLVCELSHVPPADLFAKLRGRKIGHVVFVHVERQLWENLAATRKLARQGLGRMKVTFARDGDVVEF